MLLQVFLRPFFRCFLAKIANRRKKIVTFLSKNTPCGGYCGFFALRIFKKKWTEYAGLFMIKKMSRARSYGMATTTVERKENLF